MSGPAGAGGVVALLSSAALARAFTLTAFGAVFSAVAVQRVAGTVTYVSVIAGLCVLGAAMLIARRAELSPLRLAPTSLVMFVVWALVGVFFSLDRTPSLAGWVSLAAIGFLAVVIAHVRDTLQTARALGDVFRVLLSLSLGLEILSGILLDMPIPFLGIQGNIALLGPIQGVFGTRNLLGFVTVLALITFLVEYRTQSVRVGTSILSVVLGGVTAALTDSPTVLVVAAAVAAAAAALTAVRNARPERRGPLQWTLGTLVAVGLLGGYFARGPLIEWLGAGTDFSIRSDLWSEILVYVRFRPVQGWGWFGAWSPTDFPFNAINGLDGAHASALNAFVDVLLQLGWVGLLLFLAAAGIALVRSWLVASERRSVVHAWTPLILVALLVDSLFESFTLTGLGWMLLALCMVRAGQSRSWRERIDSPAPADPPLTERLDGPTG